MSTRHTLTFLLLTLTLINGPTALRAQDDCPPALTYYPYNDETRAQVIAEAGINLRAEPTTRGAILGDAPTGADVVIDANATPVCADGYRWQPVTFNGTHGWVAEGRGGDAGYNLSPVFLRVGAQGRVSYQYDDRFAGQIDAQTVAPNNGEPGYEEIHFMQYRYGQGIIETPYFLRLYRTADLPEGSVYTETVAQIQDAIHARVNQTPYTPQFPLLPPPAGSEVAYAQMAYFRFDGGEGVRVLTAYRQDDGAVALAYWFLGLTYDGDYLLSVTIPLDAAALDASTPADIAAQAGALPAHAFTPPLDQVDVLVRSLAVDRAEGVVDSATDAPLTSAVFQGIRFTYPSALARRVEFDTVAPNGDIARMSIAGPQPGRTHVSFVGYSEANRIRDPQIVVIDAGSAPPNATQFRASVDRLRALLDAAPATATAESPNDDPTAMTLLSPGERLFLQPEWVTFEGGRGIRYLTTFTQNYVYNVQPQSLYYVFEGLSDDSQTLVYAQFPLTGSYTIHTPPNDPTDITGGPTEMAEREAEYIAEVSRELDGIASEAFEPALSTLDAIVESLEVR